MARKARPIETKAEFAARHERQAGTVRVWIARGKIWGPALTPDGRIDVDIANAQLSETLDQFTGRWPKSWGGV